MKREIKFRAWDKQNKKMLKVAGVELISGREIMSVGTLLPDEAVYGKVNSSNLSLMQFTGLHDNNGREIYESDIVRVQETMDGGRIVCLEAIASVFWNKKRGCWGCEGGFEGHLADYAFGTMLNVMGNVCEVVGNIYENPELLEAEK